MCWYLLALILWATGAARGDFNCSQAPGKDMQTTCMMIQEWDSNARKAIVRRQAFESNIGAPGIPGNPNFSPAVPQRFAPSAQGYMQTTCMMIQEWDSNARKAIVRRQAFESNIGAPGIPGNPNFSPAVPQRFAPSAQGCMNIQCICPYMGLFKMKIHAVYVDLFVSNNTTPRKFSSI
ncbi:hypothetical protein TELCIR_20662 [Teladorsagia circumcincta]|uniref:Uncharacterized protein n=1 Tax=Teladorsagia circumcincta TaxID=45464 RepID=A0A2G9TIW7_TELCI|nr:hypothetical protein TELCIR_20662 [Teladorsagia circumcincta]